jgi:class 3 adenylate cyclase
VRLRRKLTIAFFGVSSLLSVLLALFLYRFVERQLKEDLRDRLKDVTHLGSHMIDQPAYRRLIAQFDELDKRLSTLAESPEWKAACKKLAIEECAPTAEVQEKVRADKDVPAPLVAQLDELDNKVADVEHSADYKLVYDQLNIIRAAEPKLIHFVYLLAPTEDADTPRFVVDADVLALRAKLAAGQELGAHEEISHFAQDFDVSEIPLLKQALADCREQYEPDFVHDPEFDVNSVSAYIPLADLAGSALRDPAGRCLGVIGVDITDRKMRAALDEAGGLALRLSLAVVALALIVSIAMGTVLTRSIHALSETVKKFAEKDFTARTQVASRDEIGQLGKNFNEMAATIQLHSEHLEDLVKQRTSELVAEKQTSERLLLNVLPAPIADRLKHGESLIVDRFDAVSVLFADIVGFTSLSSRTSPEVLVTMLNELFSMFDKLAEQHGLEKIKTIGDAYMVVAGIPQPVADHATAIAHMALDMQAGIAAYAQRNDSELTIRIGIHTGSVVAGVIGTKKFIYDLWGDTVNTASRMESSGLPGRIQVSEATAVLLKDQFELEDRGAIEVKGKGTMHTYLLVGQRGDPERVSIGQITKAL